LQIHWTKKGGSSTQASGHKRASGRPRRARRSREYYRYTACARPCGPHGALAPCTLTDVWLNSQQSAPPSAISWARRRPKWIGFERMCLLRPRNRRIVTRQKCNRQYRAPTPASPRLRMLVGRRLPASGVRIVTHGWCPSDSSRRLWQATIRQPPGYCYMYSPKSTFETSS
jgi:hypothetical protein